MGDQSLTSKPWTCREMSDLPRRQSSGTQAFSPTTKEGHPPSHPSTLALSSAALGTGSCTPHRALMEGAVGVGKK